MERLTHHNYFDDCLYLDTEKQLAEYNLNLYKKVKIYEDIEDELGIDLITLFKALKNGIWENDKYCDKILYLKPEKFTIVLKEKYIYYEWGWPGPDYFIYHFKDYGKTWALTKEELEDE